MKKVTIYSRGTCDTSSREGSYFIKLDYMGKYKGFTGPCYDATVNRCIIQGLIEGVKKVKEPCKIQLITATKIGVKKYVRSRKGTNKDLLAELLLLLEKGLHHYTFTVLEGEGVWLRNEIESAIIPISYAVPPWEELP